MELAMTTKVQISENDTEWPGHWQDWTKESFNCLFAAEERASDFIPASAPEWTHKMMQSLIEMCYPTWDLKKISQTGPQALGAYVGHQQWLEESEFGLQAQMIRLEESLSFIDDLLRRKLSDEKYARIIEEGKKYEADIEKYCDAFDYSIEQKSVISKSILKLAEDQSIEEKADFFEAYAKALKTPTFDSAGKPTKEPFPGTSTIYLLMVLFWRHVQKMSSMKELHDWLCRLLGERTIGPYDNGRIKGICKRFKIKLAPRGRPKKKRH